MRSWTLTRYNDIFGCRLGVVLHSEFLPVKRFWVRLPFMSHINKEIRQRLIRSFIGRNDTPRLDIACIGQSDANSNCFITFEYRFLCRGAAPPAALSIADGVIYQRIATRTTINRFHQGVLVAQIVILRVRLDYRDFLKFVGHHFESFDGRLCARAIAPYLHSTTSACHHQDVCHWFAGMFKRILPDLDPNPLFLPLFVQFYRQQVDKLTPLDHIEMSHEFLDTWLDESKYNLTQKKAFHNSLQAYLDDPKSSHDLYACNSFIKREMYEEPKYARIINSRSDTFKAITAPYVKLIENQIYDNHFIKHHRPEWTVQRMIEINRTYGQVIETDYSSFEGSFTHPLLMETERYLFAHMLKNNPAVAHVVDRAYRQPNVMIHSSGCAIRTLGTRMSGEMWTSMGNGFMNKVLVEFLYKAADTTGDYLVEGDDGFVASLKPLPWHLLSLLGFRLKSEYHDNINDLSFCGIGINADGKVTGDVMRQLRNFGFTMDDVLVKNSTGKRYRKRLAMMRRAKALSAAATFKGAPLLHVIVSDILKKTTGVKPTKDCFDWWEVDTFGDSIYDGKVEPPSQADRILFGDKTGIYPELQIAIEEEMISLLKDRDVFELGGL